MEGYIHTGLVFEDQAPYPEIRVEQRCHRYGEAMLDNVGGVNSEMSAVALYLYDHWMTAEAPEVCQAFHKISLVEMRHMEIFAGLARQMGEEPRLWGIQQGRRRWWSPGNLPYQRKLGPLLRLAVREEKAAIRKYRAQCRWIGDRNVVEHLRRVIQDEERHIAALEELYSLYGAPGEQGAGR